MEIYDNAIISTGYDPDLGSNIVENYDFSNTTQGDELDSGTLSIGSQYVITATETDHFYEGCFINGVFIAEVETVLDENNKVKLLTTVSFSQTIIFGTYTANDYIAISDDDGELSNINNTPSRIRFHHSDTTNGIMGLYIGGVSSGEEYFIDIELSPGYTITGDGILLIINGDLSEGITITSGSTSTKLSTFLTITDAGIGEVILIASSTSVEGSPGTLDVYIEKISIFKVL